MYCFAECHYAECRYAECRCALPSLSHRFNKPECFQVGFLPSVIFEGKEENLRGGVKQRMRSP
jgi:hypothetical protein